MSARRGYVCLCMDITEKDIDKAIADGFTHPELVKRYTASFMGPCQGKSCMETVLETLSERTGEPLEEMRRPTRRSPIHPVTLSVLAGRSPDDE